MMVPFQEIRAILLDIEQNIKLMLKLVKICVLKLKLKKVELKQLKKIIWKLETLKLEKEILNLEEKLKLKKVIRKLEILKLEILKLKNEIQKLDEPEKEIHVQKLEEIMTLMKEILTLSIDADEKANQSYAKDQRHWDWCIGDLFSGLIYCNPLTIIGGCSNYMYMYKIALMSPINLFHGTEDAPPPDHTTVTDPLICSRKLYSPGLFTRLGYYTMTSLLVLGMTPQCQGEGHFIEIPKNTPALLGSTATFECAAEDVAAITFLVKSMFIGEMAFIEVQESLPVYSGNQIRLSLYIQATINTDKWPVVCIAFLHNVTRMDSPTAYLHVKAPPSAPQNLTAIVTEATGVFLTWSPPMDTGLGGVILYYNVSYQDPNGALYYVANISTPHHNVTGLSPNTTYKMTVMADNGISENEGNRTVSVNVTTNATTSAPKDTIINDLAWYFVVVYIMVGVMALVVIVLVMLVMFKRAHAYKSQMIYVASD